jgi:hypothetical protein
MSKDKTYFKKGREYYETSGLPVWPHRYHELPDSGDTATGRLIDSSHLVLLINRLDDLERETRPSSGSMTAEAKDLAAFRALRLAGDLTNFVAGWAIDHQVGLASEGLRFVPLQPSETKDRPQYQSERSRADSHKHEKNGGRVNGANINPQFARRALVNLLHSNPGAFPGWLTQLVTTSIDRLQYGEVPAIFAPTRDGDKRGSEELQFMMLAISMVAYRRKIGKLKKDALLEVGQAYGVDPETVKSWERRLRAKFGSLEVERTLAFARDSASHVKAALKKIREGEDDVGKLDYLVANGKHAPPRGHHNAGAGVQDGGGDDADLHESLYDDNALAIAGKRYLAALKG